MYGRVLSMPLVEHSIVWNQIKVTGMVLTINRITLKDESTVHIMMVSNL